MGWESRNGRGRYYTRSVKRNGRVLREYVGAGALAEAAAEIDAAEREQRRLLARVAREERRSRDALTAEAALDEAADLWMRVVLVAAGYRQHERGEWRRRHGPEERRD